MVVWCVQPAFKTQIKDLDDLLEATGGDGLQDVSCRICDGICIKKTDLATLQLCPSEISRTRVTSASISKKIALSRRLKSSSTLRVCSLPGGQPLESIFNEFSTYSGSQSLLLPSSEHQLPFPRNKTKTLAPFVGDSHRNK